MKVIFFGSSSYCLPILESLNKNFQLIAVITKKGLAVEKFPMSHNIKTFIPRDKKELSNLESELKSLSPDLAIVADYGLIIPPEIFAIPRYKTLNIHFSKLPALRGPSPVQYTILLGEKTACISIIIMDKEMDTGDIILQKEIELTGSETTDSLYRKLFDIAATDLPDAINRYVKNELKPQKQNHSQATYTKHFTREDGFIPSQLLDMTIKGVQPTKDQISKWDIFNSVLSQLPTTHYQLPMFIERATRAFSPWPGFWTKVTINKSKKRLKILRAHLDGDKIIPDLVQLEGKKPVSWKQFRTGYPQFNF